MTVQNRKLQAELSTAQNKLQQAEDELYRRARNSLAATSPRTPPGGRSPTETSLINALKSKVKQVQRERDKAVAAMEHVQHSTRATRVEELEAEVNVLQAEILRQNDIR